MALGSTKSGGLLRGGIRKIPKGLSKNPSVPEPHKPRQMAKPANTRDYAKSFGPPAPDPFSAGGGFDTMGDMSGS